MQSCLEAEKALQQSREAVSRVFAQAAGEVNSEIDQARSVFKKAENLLAEDSRQVVDAMAACYNASLAAFGATSTVAEQGQSATKLAMNAMLKKLNRITEAFAEASKQAAGAGNAPQ